MLVWERVNMAGAGEVSFYVFYVFRAECPCCFSSGFFDCELSRSHTDSKASGLLCPRVLTALQMAP